MCGTRSPVHRIFPLRRAGVLLAAVAFVSPTSVVGSAERPLTVDDILKLSEVGRGMARPGSDTFVLEQAPPYDTLDDYGNGAPGVWQGVDYQILTVGPRLAKPEKLFRSLPRTAYRLVGFSRDGRFLALLAIRNGKVRLAAYDFSRPRLQEFAAAPRLISLGMDPDSTWLDDHRLAVAAYPAGAAGPWPLTFRRAIGNHLAESWAKSWHGREASVDRYDSHSTDGTLSLPGRLIVLDAVSGRIEQLASGQFAGLHISPDGRWLAALRQSKLPQSTLDHPHIDWTYARSTLMLFPLHERRESREIKPELDVLPDSMVWNRSGTRLAFFAWPSGTGMRSGDFWVLDPSSGAVEVVPHANLSLASQRARIGAQWPERAAWLGDSLAVFARSTPGQPGTFAFEDIKSRGIADSRVDITSTPPHWFLLIPNASPRDLTPGMHEVSPVPVIADGTQLAILADGRVWRLQAYGPPVDAFPKFSGSLDTFADRDFNRLAGDNGKLLIPVALVPGQFAQIDAEDESRPLKLRSVRLGTSMLAVSRSGTALLQVGSGKGAALALLPAEGDPASIGEINPVLDQVAETRWTNFGYSNPEGSTRPHLSGCLLLPPGYQPDHKYPVIVEVYPDRPGGCGAPEMRNQFAMGTRPVPYSEHLLAARGFIVFRPDTGAGLSRTADGPQAALSAVVDHGVDAVLAAGYGDPTRVGLIGFSQGGFAALWVATQSRRYRAVVSLNGWSDLAEELFQMNWTQELAPNEMSSEGDFWRYLTPAGSDFYMGGTPWSAPTRYIANSPLWRSDTVSAPVLLIHSDMDGFHDTSYEMFFTSLYVQKKDARLLIYRGEGHAPSSPANIRDMWGNIFEWLDGYLGVRRDARGNIILRNSSAARHNDAS
jgi:dipeptidyl aminopeptidase/acylaminoacyl peptidase